MNGTNLRVSSPRFSLARGIWLINYSIQNKGDGVCYMWLKTFPGIITQ